jgi:hypothetical protein
MEVITIKKPIKTSQALQIVAGGGTVYYESPDGRGEIKKGKKGKYSFAVIKDGVKVEELHGNMQNLLLTLNRESATDTLYQVLNYQILTENPR